MKRLATAALVLSLFTACNNENSNMQTVDSAARVGQIEVEPASSHPDQDKVIDEITFGISEKEFNKKKDAFLKKSKRNSDLSYSIGDYRFSRLEGYFDNDKLYSAQLTGDYVHYDSYKSELINQIETLRLMMTSKYGEHFSGDGAPAWHTTENNYSYLAYRWNIGTKSVEIRVANHETYFSADLHIFQPEVVSLLEQNSLKKSKESAEKAKDVF